MNENPETQPIADNSASLMPEPGPSPETPGAGGQVLDNLLEALGGLLDGTQRLIEAHGANFLIALITLLVAWLLATAVRGFASKLFRAAGLDLIAERTGFQGYLNRHDITTRPSRAAGWVLYVAILYTALLAAFDLLGFTTGSELLRVVASYLPHLLAALVLIALGAVLGKWADFFVSRSARLAGLPAHQLFGLAARLAVLLLAVVLATETLGWFSPTLLLGALGVILAAAVGTFLIFALCARDLAESLFSRGFLTSLYKPGDRLRIEGVEGTVIRIDLHCLRLDCGDRESVIPNRQLTRQTVEILKRQSPDSGPGTNPSASSDNG